LRAVCIVAALVKGSTINSAPLRASHPAKRRRDRAGLMQRFLSSSLHASLARVDGNHKIVGMLVHDFELAHAQRALNVLPAQIVDPKLTGAFASASRRLSRTAAIQVDLVGAGGP
jgi:hypothetical protein